MSEESTDPDLVALTRGLSEAPSVDESLAYYAPDAVYDMSRMGMTTFEGREAIGVFFRDWAGNYDEYEDEIQEIAHVGGGVVFVVVRQNARPAGSPQHVRLREIYGYTFVWEGDKIVHATVYPDIDEARAAAGRLAEERGSAVSQENVETVRDAFQSFSAKGIDAALSRFSPDVVWYTTDRWLDGSAYRGHEGIRRLVAAFSENFDDFRYDVHEVRNAQDGVVALVDMIGRIKHSGSEVSQRLGFVVSGFRDGTFREIRAFPSWHEALEAAGLEE